jgi:hypothetical protein
MLRKQEDDESQDVREQINRDLEERDHLSIMPQPAILAFRPPCPAGWNICGPQAIPCAFCEPPGTIGNSEVSASDGGHQYSSPTGSH